VIEAEIVEPTKKELLTKIKDKAMDAIEDDGDGPVLEINAKIKN